MNNAENAGQPAAGGAAAPGLPAVADRATFIAQWPRLAAGRSDDLGTGRN
jgi:hypothetical protein